MNIGVLAEVYIAKGGKTEKSLILYAPNSRFSIIVFMITSSKKVIYKDLVKVDVARATCTLLVSLTIQ
jgi:hypothetical protein